METELKDLSNAELLTSLSKLSLQEGETTVNIILHLICLFAKDRPGVRKKNGHLKDCINILLRNKIQAISERSDVSLLFGARISRMEGPDNSIRTEL